MYKIQELKHVDTKAGKVSKAPRWVDIATCPTSKAAYQYVRNRSWRTLRRVEVKE